MNKTNTKIKNDKFESELNCYFKQAGNIKCPPSMKKNLYRKIAQQKNHSWFSPRLAVGGLTIAFVGAMVFNLTNKQQDLQNIELTQAQTDLKVAMHYMNRVSLKSLSAVNNKGIRPGLIKPLAQTYASL